MEEGTGIHKKLFYYMLLFVLIFIVCSVSRARAEEYEGSIAQMPIYSESASHGIFIDLVRAMERASGHRIHVRVYPFIRSMDNVIKQAADFHLPFIKSEAFDEAELPFSYSTSTPFHVNFVLYTRKEGPVTLDNLPRFKVETDRAHVQYFPFPTIASNSVEQSVKKLAAGRIDAFIFQDKTTDSVLRRLGYSNIKRTLFKRFECKFLVPKNDRGKEVDAMLTAVINQLDENGQLHEILGATDAPYDDWQP